MHKITLIMVNIRMFSRPWQSIQSNLENKRENQKRNIIKIQSVQAKQMTERF